LTLKIIKLKILFLKMISHHWINLIVKKARMQKFKPNRIAIQNYWIYLKIKIVMEGNNLQLMTQMASLIFPLENLMSLEVKKKLPVQDQQHIYSKKVSSKHLNHFFEKL